MSVCAEGSNGSKVLRCRESIPISRVWQVVVSRLTGSRPGRLPAGPLPRRVAPCPDVDGEWPLRLPDVLNAATRRPRVHRQPSKPTAGATHSLLTILPLETAPAWRRKVSIITRSARSAASTALMRRSNFEADSAETSISFEITARWRGRHATTAAASMQPDI